MKYFYLGAFEFHLKSLQIIFTLVFLSSFLILQFILFQKNIQQLPRKRPKLPYPWRFDKKMWKTMCPGLENGYKTTWWRCCPIKKRKSKAEVSAFHFRSVRGENMWKPLVQRPVSKGSFLNYVGQLEFEGKRLLKNPLNWGKIIFEIWLFTRFIFIFLIVNVK